MRSDAQDVLNCRARLLAGFRDWFRQREILEVETPILGRAAVCDPHIHSLSALIGGERFYLHTSPEFAMKRLLASGSGSIYQIGKVFRNDEQSRLHNPEFTMIEWYQIGLDYHALMGEIVELLTNLLKIERITALTYQQAFQQTVGIDPLAASYSELTALAGKVTGQMSKDDLLDLILSMKVLPAFKNNAVFIYDYPKSQAALSKIRGEIAERFELIVNGIELANGYTELTDAQELQQRFIHDNQQRLRIGLEPMPIDQLFLDAMTRGLPECAGVALGFDRLVMIALGKQSLAEVMPFPFNIA